jgi:hypothetical protein
VEYQWNILGKSIILKIRGWKLWEKLFKLCCDSGEFGTHLSSAYAILK